MTVALDFTALFWKAGIVWVVVALGFSTILALQIRGRSVEHLPSSGWQYAIGLIVVNSLLGVVVCGVLGGVSATIVLFGVAVGLLCGIIVGTIAQRRRNFVFAAREAERR